MICSSTPNHRLILKVGVLMMLLRNINQISGFCNETWLIVNQLGNNIINATIVIGQDMGDSLWIEFLYPLFSVWLPVHQLNSAKWKTMPILL